MVEWAEGVVASGLRGFNPHCSYPSYGLVLISSEDGGVGRACEYTQKTTNVIRAGVHSKKDPRTAYALALLLM